MWGQLSPHVYALSSGSYALVYEPCHFMRGLPHVRWEGAGASEYSWAAPVVLWGISATGLVLANEWDVPILSQGLGLGSPIELLGCAAVWELTTRPLRFSEEELSFLREYDRRAGLEPLSDDGYLILPPTQLIVLMHPAVTSRLLAHLDPQTILRFRHHQQYSLANGSSPPVGYPSVKRAIIDTHFHLDSFSSRQGRSLSDLES